MDCKVDVGIKEDERGENVSTCDASMMSIPFALLLSGRRDEALCAVQDCLYVGKDLLIQTEYADLEDEMRRFADEVFLW